MLFGHQHRRAREVDERALVLDEAAAGSLALRRGAGGDERLQAVEPQLRHAIVRLGPAAPAPQPFVHGRRQRVDLRVAANAERLGGLAHERAVPFPPVALELLAPEIRQALETEHERDHQGTPKSHASPWRTMRPAVGWWKCVPSTATAPPA